MSEGRCESCGSTEPNARSSRLCPECQCPQCGGMNEGDGGLCPSCQDIHDEIVREEEAYQRKMEDRCEDDEEDWR